MEFEKYLKEGAYHWDATSANPFRHVAFTSGRYQAIMRLPLPWNGSKVLDIACGDLRVAAYAADAGARYVTGVDASIIGIEVGRKRWAKEQPRNLNKVGLVQGDGLKLPVKDRAFDIVIASEIIEHIDDPRAFIRESARTIKPGGVLVVTTPLRLTDKPLDPFHVREYLPGELETIHREFFSETSIVLSHPAWVTSLYTLGGWARPFRFLVNLLAILGHNPFLEWPLARYPAQITLVARKPIQ